MFPSESIEVPSLEANLRKYFLYFVPSKDFHWPVCQRVWVLAARAVCDVIKYQHHLVDENYEASKEKPAGQL